MHPFPLLWSKLRAMREGRFATIKVRIPPVRLGTDDFYRNVTRKRFWGALELVLHCILQVNRAVKSTNNRLK